MFTRCKSISRPSAPQGGGDADRRHAIPIESHSPNCIESGLLLIYREYGVEAIPDWAFRFELDMELRHSGCLKLSG